MQRDHHPTEVAEDAPIVPVEPASDLADAHHAIGYAGMWINNADTKAGLLSAALAVVVAAATQQSRVIGDVLRPGGGGEWAALVVLCLLGLAIVVGVVALGLVITPRTPPPAAPSRFGFPTLASHGWRHVPATRAQAAEEAWGQAHVLSRIATRKFAALRVASIAVFSSFPLYGCWIVTTSLID